MSQSRYEPVCFSALVSSVLFPSLVLQSFRCGPLRFFFSVICVFICTCRAAVCSVFSGEKFLMPSAFNVMTFKSFLSNKEKHPFVYLRFFFPFLPILHWRTALPLDIFLLVFFCCLLGLMAPFCFYTSFNRLQVLVVSFSVYQIIFYWP